MNTASELELEHARGLRRRPRVSWLTVSARVFVVLVYFFMLSPLIFVVWLSFFADAIPLSHPPATPCIGIDKRSRMSRSHQGLR